MKRVAVSTLKPSVNETNVSVHPSCVIDPSVQLGEGVVIHANVVISRGAQIGADTIIHVGCFIGEDCILGEGTVLDQFVTLREKTHIGNRVVIGAGVVIGSDGFGYAKQEDGQNFKVPQVGYVVVEDGVRIGANSTIDRATLGRTVIGRNARIGNLVQIGHNVDIGVDSVVGDSVGVCGSCKIGERVSIGHGVGMVGHIRIGDNANVSSGSGISKDVPDRARMIGIPAMEEEAHERFYSFIEKLPEFADRLKTLEQKLEK